ncbi:transcription antitermination factor NusB, partial [Acinetobacter baumannii]|nr:transcription antitermination factor NusB [Acinetobacter baumannii]
MTEEDELLFPVYKPQEDAEFARALAHKTFLEFDKNIQLIDQHTKNWELDRISEMDKLIMGCAVSELK